MRVVAIVARYLAGNHVHRIRPERLLTIHPPATADKSIGVAIPRRDLRVPLFSFLIRGSSISWFAFALRIRLACRICNIPPLSRVAQPL